MHKTILKLLFTLFVLTISQLNAQDKNDKIYKERSVEVKKEIWGEPNAAFDVSKVPDEYKDESAVIIARSVFYSQDKKNRIKLTLFGPSFNNSRNNYITTIRETVKINDQTVLDEYSSLEYRNGLIISESIVHTLPLNSRSNMHEISPCTIRLVFNSSTLL